METLEDRLQKRIHVSLYALLFLTVLLGLSVLLESCAVRDEKESGDTGRSSRRSLMNFRSGVGEFKLISEVKRPTCIFTHYNTLGLKKDARLNLVYDWVEKKEVKVYESDCSADVQPWGGNIKT